MVTQYSGGVSCYGNMQNYKLWVEWWVATELLDYYWPAEWAVVVLLAGVCRRRLLVVCIAAGGRAGWPRVAWECGVGTLPAVRPAGRRARGQSARRRLGGRHCTTGQSCYVPLGWALVLSLSVCYECVCVSNAAIFVAFSRGRARTIGVNRRARHRV